MSAKARFLRCLFQFGFVNRRHFVVVGQHRRVVATSDVYSYFIRNSSLFLPLSHNGARPRPVQVTPLTGSLYLAATELLTGLLLTLEPVPRSAVVRPYSFMIAAIFDFALASSCERTASAWCVNSAIWACNSEYVGMCFPKLIS